MEWGFARRRREYLPNRHNYNLCIQYTNCILCNVSASIYGALSFPINYHWVKNSFRAKLFQVYVSRVRATMHTGRICPYKYQLGRKKNIE